MLTLLSQRNQLYMLSAGVGSPTHDPSVTVTSVKVLGLFAPETETTGDTVFTGPVLTGSVVDADHTVVSPAALLEVTAWLRYLPSSANVSFHLPVLFSRTVQSSGLTEVGCIT
ncbi:unannotated protein [freshwater metagenome]|uniref:Unannotated protein n=1 Tax=freshwater metagenome TaxID=449393 RepID=A0A6J6GLC7_9ZZZZ